MTETESPHIEIVAELAQGFEGNPELSGLLLKAAATAGADAAKFQLVYADELATPDYKYYDLFKTLEMPDAVWAGLAKQAADADMALHLDIFGPRSLKLAETIGVGTVKLHGTDINNLGFLKTVASSSVRRVMLGAGGAFNSEIRRAINSLDGKDVVVLLGFQGYPTPNETNAIARLGALADLCSQEGARVVLGFADHAPPEDLTRFALATTALGAGARIFEKHLTLGRIMKLEDHESALNPDEFAEFSSVLRDCAKALGIAKTGDDFGMSESEQGYRKMIRRHVIASRDLTVGATLSPADLILKRSSAEDVITDMDSAYGRKLKKARSAGEALRIGDVDAGPAQ